MYTCQKTGNTGFASFNKLKKIAINEFKSFADSNNCNFEVVSAIKTSVKYGTGVPRATVTFKLLNKDGTLALTDADKNAKREQAKNEIIDLKDLLDLGVITQKEFDAKVEKLKIIILTR